MDIIGQLISFVLGMSSSWLFWRFLLTTKPKIDISPMIAYSIKEDVLIIKVINIGRRQATDINAFVFIGGRLPDKRIKTIYDPKLEENHRIALGPIQDLKTLWVLPTISRFRILDAKKILEMLASANTIDNRIVFTLSSMDALSSTKIVQRVTYKIKDVMPGEFIPGTNFLVVDFESASKNRDNPNMAIETQANDALLLKLLQNQ